MNPVSIGLLGHVDAGKTSLARALSTTLSTAALDKHPESQRRGITLDIGISNYELGPYLVTIIDCPGHYAFLKSVLAGAAIVQVLVVIVDAVRGIQTQTAEAVGIAEALQLPVICVLNKIDAVGEERVAKLEKGVAGVFTKLKLRFEVCRTSAANGDVADFNAKLLQTLNGIYPYIEYDLSTMKARPFQMLFDHSFGGKYAPIYTGTVLAGELRAGDEVCISPGSGLKNGYFETFAVKGIYSYKTQLERATPGVRVGVQLNGGTLSLERGILCSPDVLRHIKLCKCRIRILRQYSQGIRLGEHFTIALGCVSVQARVFPLGNENSEPLTEKQYEYAKNGDFSHKKEVWCYVSLERQIDVPKDVKIIGVRTDISSETNKSLTRIAFSGYIEEVIEQPTYAIRYWVRKLYKAVIDKKQREGYTVIKEIPKFPAQVSPVGCLLIYNDCVFGEVKSEFGYGKFKAQLTEPILCDVDVFVELRIVQEHRME